MVLSLQVYYHGYLLHVSSAVKTKSVVCGTARKFYQNICFIIITIFPFNLHELSTNPAWAGFTTTSLIRHTHLSNWCVPKASGDVFLQGVGAATRSQPLTKSRPNPYAWYTLHKLNNNNLAVRTLPLYHYILHKLEFLLLEVLNLYLILPNVILPFSPPRISLTWFRTRIGNKAYATVNSYLLSKPSG